MTAIGEFVGQSRRDQPGEDEELLLFIRNDPGSFCLQVEANQTRTVFHVVRCDVFVAMWTRRLAQTCFSPRSSKISRKPPIQPAGLNFRHFASFLFMFASSHNSSLAMSVFTSSSFAMSVVSETQTVKRSNVKNPARRVTVRQQQHLVLI